MQFKLSFPIKLLGLRENIQNVDLSATLPEDIEEEVKAAAEISMGTEVSNVPFIILLFVMCPR